MSCIRRTGSCSGLSDLRTCSTGKSQHPRADSTESMHRQCGIAPQTAGNRLPTTSQVTERQTQPRTRWLLQLQSLKAALKYD